MENILTIYKRRLNESKKLIEELKKFDEELEVQFDFQEFQTFYIDGVKETTEDYKEGNEKIVAIY